MRRASFLLGAIVFVAASSGCGGLAALKGKAGPPAVVIPDLKDVSQVRVEIEENAAAGNRFPGAPFELVIKDGPDVKQVLDWLRGVDWTQDGADLTPLGLALDGSIDITLRDDSTLGFQLAQAGIIYENRLRNADTDRLARVVNRLRKKG